MFFWNSRFFHDPVDVGSLISGFSAFSKSLIDTPSLYHHIIESLTTIHLLFYADLQFKLFLKKKIIKKLVETAILKTGLQTIHNIS